MLMSFTAWVVQYYMNSPGRVTVLVEIFAILALSYSSLFDNFMVNVLLNPEKNTKNT